MANRLDDVVDAGDHGGYYGSSHQCPIDPEHPITQQHPQGEQIERDSDGLENGLELATARRRDNPIAQNRHAIRGDAEFANEDDHGYPPRQLPDDRETDKGAAD